MKSNIKFISLLLSIVILVSAFTTTVISAWVDGDSSVPWRGSWLARGYIYTKGVTSADFNADWMQTTTYLLENEGSGWFEDTNKQAWAYNVNQVTAWTDRYLHINGSWWMTETEHEYTEGYDYQSFWSQSPATYL